METEDLNRKGNKVKHGLPSKRFQARNSPLTDLLENVHIRTIYNFAWVVVFTSQLHYLLDNYLTYGSFSFNLEFFKISFSKPYPLVYIWVCLFMASLLPYFGFVLWATIRNKIKKLSISFLDRLSITIFILYFATYTYYFAFLIHRNNFQPASAIALMFEFVRFKMKFYAFVRSNVLRVIKFNHRNKDEILYPSILKYLYFSFAPTLLYQDEYPRSKSIRWKKVAEHFVNFGGCLLLINIMLEHFLTHSEIFSRNPFKWINFVLLVLQFTPSAGMFLLTINYLFFHCWLNAFAEMLRFSDRNFYKDFWTCTSYNSFYRSWNRIIQEWLYVYVYKDLYEKIWPNKSFAAAMVFIISALYHEFIIGITFNFVPQFLFTMFLMISMITTVFFSGAVIGNFSLLLSTGIGHSVLLCAFGIRYYYEKIK